MEHASFKLHNKATLQEEASFLSEKYYSSQVFG